MRFHPSYKFVQQRHDDVSKQLAMLTGCQWLVNTLSTFSSLAHTANTSRLLLEPTVHCTVLLAGACWGPAVRPRKRESTAGPSLRPSGTAGAKGRRQSLRQLRGLRSDSAALVVAAVAHAAMIAAAFVRVVAGVCHVLVDLICSHLLTMTP